MAIDSQIYFHRWFLQTCKAVLVHYRVCGANGEHWSELLKFQAVSIAVSTYVSYGLCASLLPTENTAPMSVA